MLHLRVKKQKKIDVMGFLIRETHVYFTLC